MHYNEYRGIGTSERIYLGTVKCNGYGNNKARHGIEFLSLVVPFVWDKKVKAVLVRL